MYHEVKYFIVDGNHKEIDIFRAITCCIDKLILFFCLVRIVNTRIHKYPNRESNLVNLATDNLIHDKTINKE